MQKHKWCTSHTEKWPERVLWFYCRIYDSHVLFCFAVLFKELFCFAVLFKEHFVIVMARTSSSFLFSTSTFFDCYFSAGSFFFLFPSSSCGCVLFWAQFFWFTNELLFFLFFTELHNFFRLYISTIFCCFAVLMFFRIELCCLTRQSSFFLVLFYFHLFVFYFHLFFFLSCVIFISTSNVYSTTNRLIWVRRDWFQAIKRALQKGPPWTPGKKRVRCISLT